MNMTKRIQGLYGAKWLPFGQDVPDEGLYVPARVENFRSSSEVGVADRATPRPEPGAALALGTPDTIPSCERRDGRAV